MSQNNYIRNLLNLKDENIKFYENWCEESTQNNKKCKIINAYLSYEPGHCDKSFTCSTPFVNYGCFISNNTKLSIEDDLAKKRSEKDIAIDNNVSPNTVERVIDSYYKAQKLYKYFLPEVLSFDEFKSVKSTAGVMSFHMYNGKTGKILDIVEDRRLHSLIKVLKRIAFGFRSFRKFKARIMICKGLINPTKKKHKTMPLCQFILSWEV